MYTKKPDTPIFAAKKKKNSNMSKLMRTFWLLSILIFLGILLYVYANLPGEVALSFNAGEESGWTIPKSTFFYGSLLVFVIVNVILYVFGLILRRLPFPEPKNSYWLANPELRTNISIWITSFNFVVNLLLVSIILAVGFINNDNTSGYYFFIYFGPALVMIWLIILILTIIRGR